MLVELSQRFLRRHTRGHRDCVHVELRGDGVLPAHAGGRHAGHARSQPHDEPLRLLWLWLLLWLRGSLQGEEQWQWSTKRSRDR